MLGLLVSWWVGDPLAASRVTAGLGWLLVAAVAVWNGWALKTIAKHRTALLPGGATTIVIERGPFAWSRNPLYIGLLVASAGAGLVVGSVWAHGSSPSMTTFGRNRTMSTPRWFRVRC